MFAIDIKQGVQILEAFCRKGSQLHVRGRINGELAWSPAMIAKASDSKVCFKFFDTPGTEQYECEISLAGSQMFYDPTGTTTWIGAGAYPWRSALRIAYRDGTDLVLGERDFGIQ